MVSVVASWSVAFPLPSSPHWAPRMTIAGITASFGDHASRRTTRVHGHASSPGNSAPGLLRPHDTAARPLVRTDHKSLLGAHGPRIVSGEWTRFSSSPTATPA